MPQLKHFLSLGLGTTSLLRAYSIPVKRRGIATGTGDNARLPNTKKYIQQEGLLVISKRIFTSPLALQCWSQGSSFHIGEVYGGRTWRLSLRKCGNISWQCVHQDEPNSTTTCAAAKNLSLREQRSCDLRHPLIDFSYRPCAIHA